MKGETLRSKQYILGIDPGNKGACALLSLDGTELDWFKIPVKKEFPGTRKGDKVTDAKELYEEILQYNITLCAIERQAFKNAKLIQNYGIVRGIVDIIGIPLLIPTPTSWMYELKRYLDLQEVRNSNNKEFTFTAFEKVFSGVTLPNNDDNIADASLLAYYAYIMMQKAEGD